MDQLRAEQVRAVVDKAFEQHLCRCRAEPEQDCLDHGDAYSGHIGAIYHALLDSLAAMEGN